jgi:hypothetical protein
LLGLGLLDWRSDIPVDQVLMNGIIVLWESADQDQPKCRTNQLITMAVLRGPTEWLISVVNGLAVMVGANNSQTIRR